MPPGADSTFVWENTGNLSIWTQEEIVDEILQSRSSAGRNVARLKGGDPAVFARTAEED